MSDCESIVADSTIENRPIIERKLKFSSVNQKWVFSPPKTVFKKSKRKFQCLDIITQLVANDQESRAILPVSSSTNTDSGFESEASYGTKPDADKWEPPKLEVGNFYFVPTGNRWSSAKLERAYINGFFKFLSYPDEEVIWVTSSNLAYLEQDVTFTVGSHVVGQCHHNKETGEVNSGKPKFKMGVVAEEPSEFNKKRYLVIFDDGCWRYVNTQSVWLTHFQAKDIWKILPDPSRIIVRSFLKNGYKKVINYKIGDYITYKFRNEEEVCGTVVCVDCSLILVWFYSTNSSVWLHKGSPFMVQTTVNFNNK